MTYSLLAESSALQDITYVTALCLMLPELGLLFEHSESRQKLLSTSEVSPLQLQCATMFVIREGNLRCRQTLYKTWHSSYVSAAVMA